MYPSKRSPLFTYTTKFSLILIILNRRWVDLCRWIGSFSLIGWVACSSGDGPVNSTSDTVDHWRSPSIMQFCCRRRCFGRRGSERIRTGDMCFLFGTITIIQQRRFLMQKRAAFIGVKSTDCYSGQLHNYYTVPKRRNFRIALGQTI